MEQVGERTLGLHETTAMVIAAFLALALFGSQLMAEWAARLGDEPELVYNTLDYDMIQQSPTVQAVIEGWRGMKGGLVRATDAWRQVAAPVGLNSVYLAARGLRLQAQGLGWAGTVRAADGAGPRPGDPHAPGEPYTPGEAYDPGGAPYTPGEAYDPGGAPYTPGEPYDPSEPYTPGEPYDPSDPYTPSEP